MPVPSLEQDGFMFPLELFTPEEAQTLRSKWDELEAREGLRNWQEEPRLKKALHNRHLDQEFLWDLAHHPAILGAMTPILGPNILLYGTRVICKWGGDEGSFVAWHQDVSVRHQLFPPVQITAWYAIDDSDVANGCVRCIPGSHKRGMRDRLPAGYEGNLLRVNEETPVSDEEAGRAVNVTLRSGQASLHDGLTIHSSGVNQTRQRRCGVVLRYSPAYVTQGADVEYKQRDNAVVVCGADTRKDGLSIAAP
jgi:non-haem Fe2+, alpha-ketoglutarate-dependent halogenase